MAVSLLTTQSSFGATVPIKADSLRCDQVANPLAINNPRPTLSWQMNLNASAKSQNAFRILVAGSLKELNGNQGTLWDSGRVASSDNTQVQYKGAPLTSRTRAFWKVMIWDEKDRPSAWSRPASWTMGLLSENDWSAQWIGAFEDTDPDSTATHPAPYFRKEFPSLKKVSKATAHISGLGFYELSINGKKIGHQVLAPAVTNYDKRPLKNLLYPYDDQSTQRVLYNSFDVTSHVKRGENCVGVLLGNGWYNQRDRTVEGKMWYDVPKLIFQLELTYSDGSVEKVVSDKSWKTSSGPLLHDGIFSGEKYDARLSLGNWQQTGFNDSSWRPVLLVRAPTGKMEAQTAPFDKVMRWLQPVRGEKKGLVSKFHLDETVSGWASIKVNGKAGSEVKIRYISEEGHDYDQIDTYILKGEGSENWKPRFTWHTFRDLEVTSSDDSVDIESIDVEDVHTSLGSNGSFECSNPLFNKIHEAYLRTQRANLHGSVSSDCSHRERLGYTGDGQVAIESVLFTFDAFQFYRKWIEDIDDARNKKTGFVTHTAPFGGGGGGPAWGSAYVIMPWSLYRRFGDSSILQEHYSGMKQWVSYLQTRTDEKGLVVREEPDGWCLGDWGTPTDVQIPEPFVNTAYFYHVTDTMAKVAQALGKKDDEDQFRKLAGKIKADFNRAYFNPNEKSYWEGRQGANVFPLAFGLVPDGEQKAVFSNLLLDLKKTRFHFDTGILGTPLLLDVLSENNRDDIAFQVMNQRDFPSFGYLLDSKNSTLWEFWNGDGSHCHPMFGSVVAWFYNGLGGIKTDPGAAGMKHFTIAPKTVADLEFCKTSYSSLNGVIRSEWKKIEGGKHEFKIEIPANSSATFILPSNMDSFTSSAGKNFPVQKVNGQSLVEFGPGVYEFKG